MNANARLKAKISARKIVCGTFIKTPHPIIVEIMAQAGYDFLVLDAEHAPFDRAAIDVMMIAGRAADIPLIVRVPALGPDWVMSVLDAGAAGIMVPHVNDAATARAVVAATRYGRWGEARRGFAGTTRAADYAQRSLKEHLGRTEDEVTVICQIEDPPGADAADDIAAVEGVDALFVGRADLAVGYGKSDFFDPDVANITRRVLGASQSATGLFCPSDEDARHWSSAGASVFVIGSDHSSMKRSAAADLRDLRRTISENDKD